MGEILGVGCTHRPVMLRRNEDWTFMMKASLDDPAMPDEMKNPARWPAPLREELGNDWGASAAARAREVYRAPFRRGAPGARRFQARSDRHVGRRPVREFQGGHRPAVRRARLRGPGHPALGAPPLARQPVERAGGQDLPRARPQGSRQIPRLAPDRGRDRRRLRLQAPAPPDGPRLREHAAAARRRAARVRLSAGVVHASIATGAGSMRRAGCACRCDEGPDPQSRPALAQPASLHGGRRRRRRGSWPTARGGSR